MTWTCVPVGAWATTMLNPDGSEHHVDGKYLEIRDPHRLVFTWAWTFDGERGHETGRHGGIHCQRCRHPDW